MPRLAVVLPMYNEAGNVAALFTAMDEKSRRTLEDFLKKASE